MMKRVMTILVSAAALTALCLSADAVGTVTVQQRQIPNVSHIPLLCMPDPGIVGVTLTKIMGANHKPAYVQIAYVVKNFGTQWQDDEGVAGGVYITVNDATHQTYSAHQNFPKRAAPGAIMVAFVTPRIANTFGSDEFVGSIDVTLSYNPDDNLDGNPCNDDNNPKNNAVHIDNNALLHFLWGQANTQTFRP